MKVSHGKNDPSRALYCINCFELSEVTLSFVEWCIHFGNGTCHLQVFIPQKSTICKPKHSWPVSHPLRVLTSTLASYTPLQSPSHRPQVHSIKLPIQNSKEIQDIPAKESGVVFFKKKEREEEKPTLHSKLQIMEFK